jgi:hypothetical protein
VSRLVKRVALAAVAVAVAAGGATAATPESGTLGKASPKIKYSGVVATQQAYPYYQIWNSDPSAPCASGCDTYTLTVADPGKVVLKFELGSAGTTGNGFIGVRIAYPDGSYTYESGESAPKSPMAVTIANAKAGEHVITVTTNFVCCNDQTFTATGDWTDPNAPAPAPTDPAPGGGGAGGTGGGGTGGGTTPPPTQPTTPQEFTVDGKVGKISAKKAKKGKTISVKATSSRSLQSMSLTFKKGTKKVGSATLSPFPGTATMKIKLTSALKKGSYGLVVAGADNGKTVAKVVKVKVAK